TIRVNPTDLINYGYSNGLLMPGHSIGGTEKVELTCSSASAGGESVLKVLWGCFNEGCSNKNPNVSTVANVIIHPGGPILQFRDVFTQDIHYGSGFQTPHTVYITNGG